MKTQQVTGGFMADCKLRGLSAKTLEDYSRHCQQLVELSPKFPPKPIIIQQFLATLNFYNADAHWRTWHAVGNYAARQYKTPNFMKAVTRPRIPKEIMPTLSNLELNLLVTFLEPAPIRDKAIFVLFIDAAIRKGEAANLKRKDILEDRIIVHGKTGYRVVPISPGTKELLLSLPVHDDGYVFHGTNKGKDSKPLGSTGLYKIVKKYLVKVGYTGKQFGPQLLRRSFGRFWLLAGGDMKTLSLILGHASVATTDKAYTPLLVNDVIQIHHKHTPGRIFAEVG